MAEQDDSPVFNIQRMYLKDLSLEQPNSPQILLEQQQPQVDINLGLSAEPVAEAMYEVCVTATVTTKWGPRDEVRFDSGRGAQRGGIHGTAGAQRLRLGSRFQAVAVATPAAAGAALRTRAASRGEASSRV